MPRSNLAAIARSPALRAAALRACPEGERDALARKMDAALQARVVRTAQGRAAQAHGVTFERWLEGQHAEAVRLGLAGRIVHTGPLVVFTRGGDPKVVGPGGADYQGTLAGGRSLVIEAKSRGGRLSRGELPQHQVADLEACASVGGLALLVFEHQPTGGRYAMPWGSVPWSSRGGIGPEECGAWEITAGERCYLVKLVEVRRG